MLSVIVPAYNEAERLPPTLARMREYLDGLTEPYEVIVVDDGSSDNTVGRLAPTIQGWPQLSVIPFHRNQGKGAAVRAGMLRARGDLRLFSDADLSTPIEEYAHLRSQISGAYQVAIASRAMRETQIENSQPLRRVIMGKTYNRLFQLLALRGIHDSQCGFKLFTAEAAETCFRPLVTRRFGFDGEVLMRAQRAGYQIAEVPVRWSHVEESRVSAVRDSLETLVDLLVLRGRIRRHPGGRPE
jgi:dolichyl-phosphate beta-glucosyltransferase